MRRTGRTTRMLAEARRLSDAGSAVYVVAAPQDRDRIARLVADDPSIKVETIASLHLDEQLQLRGGHPNCVVLTDHHAIECRWPVVVHELHRWDEDHEVCQ